jgi:hypothetical protein
MIVAACDGAPPVKNAHGERIKTVTIEERFPMSDEVRDQSITGEALRAAVASMDKHEVFELKGSFDAPGAMNQSLLTIVIKNSDDQERRVSFKNCAEPHLCSWADDAAKNGWLARRPAVCKLEAKCEPAK